MILRSGCCLAMGLALSACTSLGGGRDSYTLEVGGTPWLNTMIKPLDESSEGAREETYKVYTQVYDFDGETYLTKGAGGRYTHHRGLFIGWKDTLIQDEDYDTWHMSNCSQEHVAWLRQSSGPDGATQMQVIEWRDDDKRPFIREVRTISASRGEGGARIIDFQSELVALVTDIRLRGDLQHAGMQIRMADEVNDHQELTDYILPEGAKENEDDEVIGGWWVLGSFEVSGNRRWVLHMTHPDLTTGEPVYSIRRYGRFGSFFEPNLAKGSPLQLDFRVIVSETPLDRERCVTLYEDYAQDAWAE